MLRTYFSKTVHESIGYVLSKYKNIGIIDNDKLVSISSKLEYIDLLGHITEQGDLSQYDLHLFYSLVGLHCFHRKDYECAEKNLLKSALSKEATNNSYKPRRELLLACKLASIERNKVVDIYLTRVIENFSDHRADELLRMQESIRDGLQPDFRETDCDSWSFGGISTSKVFK